MSIQPRLLAVFLFFASLFSVELRAQESETIRESCRKSVGGAYIAAYDKLVHARETAESLEKNLKKHRLALVDAEKKFKEKSREMDKKEFDTTLASERDSAQALFESIKDQVEQMEGLLAAAKRETTTNQALMQRLEKKVMPVFKVTQVTGGEKGAYPLKIDFKGKCPKYRYSCPLTRQEAFDLLKIFESDPVGEACRKYAAYSGIE